MLLALVENKVSEPIKNLKGKCPLCGTVVISKCGDTNVHHWAHVKNDGCDSWSEQETYWHKSWKNIFPIENREFVMEQNGKKHFADIYTEDQIVIELQNSSISSEIIREREDFYGTRMFWIINGSKYRSKIGLFENERISTIRATIKENDRSYFSNLYLSNSNITKYLMELKEFNFFWDYPIRSWKNANRPIFLDIEEDFILWIINGIGTNRGTMKVFPKEKFINKYKGDYELHQKLVDNGNVYKYERLVVKVNKVLESIYKSYSYYSNHPNLSFKVIDKETERTQLRRTRWDELLIPNANSKGIYLIFCCRIDNPEEIKVLINQAINKTIGNSITPLIERKESEKIFTLLRSDWIIEYIASIPLDNRNGFIQNRPVFYYIVNRMNKDVLVVSRK